MLQQVRFAGAAVTCVRSCEKASLARLLSHRSSVLLDIYRCIILMQAIVPAHRTHTYEDDLVNALLRLLLLLLPQYRHSHRTRFVLQADLSLLNALASVSLASSYLPRSLPELICTKILATSCLVRVIF
jgi:hypothetical protein